MKIIGITGTSGAGKTTICNILKKQYSAYIIDSDEIAKRLSKKGSIYLQSIVEYFGQGILDNDGELKRSELANIIYESDEKRQRLNNLTFIYVDAPLLFESKLNQICDFVIGIIAKEEEKIQRICKRDDISVEMAKKRLNIQITEDEICKKSDFVIENNGNIEQLEKELKKISI